jgi:hypothetical protein
MGWSISWNDFARMLLRLQFLWSSRNFLYETHLMMAMWLQQVVEYHVGNHARYCRNKTCVSVYNYNLFVSTKIYSTVQVSGTSHLRGRKQACLETKVLRKVSEHKTRKYEWKKVHLVFLGSPN